MPEKQSSKTLEQLPIRLLHFAELYAKGLTAAKAAREAGFTPKTANSQAGSWIRHSREASFYPCLWDYYQKLRGERLRLFETTTDNILSELKIIAFSKIDNYLDLPSREVKKKTDKLKAEEMKLNNRLGEYTSILYAYERQVAKDKRTRKKSGDPVDEEKKEAEPKISRAEYEEALRKAEPIRKKLTAVYDKLRELEDGPGYTLRLKFSEDIPAELVPAISEIRETREGIAVKLHSKMDALDMLARYNRMFTDNAQGGDDDPGKISEVTITVKGSRSSMPMPQNSAE